MHLCELFSVSLPEASQRQNNVKMLKQSKAAVSAADSWHICGGFLGHYNRNQVSACTESLNHPLQGWSVEMMAGLKSSKITPRGTFLMIELQFFMAIGAKSILLKRHM